jgi:preprotein translocase subunit YajC
LIRKRGHTPTHQKGLLINKSESSLLLLLLLLLPEGLFVFIYKWLQRRQQQQRLNCQSSNDDRSIKLGGKIELFRRRN